MRQTEIAALLPSIFQRTLYPGNPLAGLLDVMEALQAPSEEVLAGLDAFFDPYRTPDRFVPFLAGWLDLERLLVEATNEPGGSQAPSLPTGLGRLRELIARAAYLSAWRGTARGLLAFLQTATGLQGFEIDEQAPGTAGQARPFHIRVLAPAEAAAYAGLLRRIIEAEKPAYVTYELAFKP